MMVAIGNELQDGRYKTPVVLFNPYGGESESKGFSRNAVDQQELIKILSEIVDKGYKVVLLPNSKSWGTREIATDLLNSLPEQIRKNCVVSDDPMTDAKLFKYYVGFSDYVLTVEGGMMHLAFNMGKPFGVVIKPGAGPAKWIPYRRTSMQGVVQDVGDAVRLYRERRIEQDNAMSTWQDFVVGGIKENPAWLQDPVYQRFRDHALGDPNTDPVAMVAQAKRAMEDFGIEVKKGGMGVVLGFGRKGIGEIELGQIYDDFQLSKVNGVDWVDYRVKEVAEGLQAKGYDPQKITLHHANMRDMKEEIKDDSTDLVYGFGLEGVGLLDIDQGLAQELVRVLAPGGISYLIAKPNADALAVLQQSGQIFKYSEKGSLLVFKKNATKGGIDFNTDKINLDVQNSGETIRYNIDPAMVQQLQNATGFMPVIIDIHPTGSLLQFLGMKGGADQPMAVH
jgi:ADP-heptose:LPS heptosyltransferase